MISECSKLAQKEYKTRHGWVGKVIHWDIRKKSKFDHMNKLYMVNPAPVRGNNTHKLLWDFDIHGSPNLGQNITPNNNQQQQKKRIFKILDFAVPTDHRIKLKGF